MQYQEKVAQLTATKWGLPTSTVSRWRRTGIIPDQKVFSEPLGKADLKAEERIIKLVEAGWLKAKSLSRCIGRRDKINALLTARRYPNDPAFHVHHLTSEEIGQIKPLIDKMQCQLAVINYLADQTPLGQNYNDVVQADLRALLHRQELNTVNLRSLMDRRQVGRFWAFLKGHSARRNDLDLILTGLKSLAALLSL